MDEFEMKRRIYGYIKEICHYSQMQVFATSYYQKNYFQMQIDDATGALINLYMELWAPPEHKKRRSRSYHYQANDIESYEQRIQPVGQQPWGQDLTKEQLSEAEQFNELASFLEQIPEVEQSNQQSFSSEQQPETEQPSQQEARSFTEQDLAAFNGMDGNPAYVAVNGIVYDVSSVMRWAGGTHFGLEAGRDLSGPFMLCHHGILERLSKLPKVGVLVKGV